MSHPTVGERSEAAGRAPQPAVPSRTTSSRINRASLSMAAGTLLSRVSGFAKLVALSTALGVKNPIADGYNLANTTPNIVFDLLIGGVLAATVVPVFVSRLASREEREAWDDISAVVTLAAAALVVGTVALVLLAPGIIHLYTLGKIGAHAAAERSAATLLLRLFAPQVAFYGLIGLVTAVLNARRRFAAPMFVPIANNIVVIGVLLAVHALFPQPNLVAAAHDPTLLLLLGAGTTGGVVVQGLLLLPALRAAVPRISSPRRATGWPERYLPVRSSYREDSWDRLERLGRRAAQRTKGALRWRWDPGNEAVRRIMRLSMWTFGFTVANQVAFFVVNHLAFVSGAGGVSSYTYAYTFFMLPVGIVAVSIMSAVQPELAEHWTRGDLTSLDRRAGGGLRAIVVAVIPPAVGYIVLATPICGLVLANGAGSAAGARQAASVLVAMALGLPGFCAFLFISSAFQATQDNRTVFLLYLVENGINVLAAYLLEPFIGVQGLGLALSIAYTAAALLAYPVLQRRLEAAPQAPGAGGSQPGTGPAAPAARVSDTGQLYLPLAASERSGLHSLAAAEAAAGWARLRPAGPSLGRALLRVGVLSLAMAVAVVAVATHVGADTGIGALVRVLAAGAAGVSVFAAGTALASARGGRGLGRRQGG